MTLEGGSVAPFFPLIVLVSADIGFVTIECKNIIKSLYNYSNLRRIVWGIKANDCL